MIKKTEKRVFRIGISPSYGKIRIGALRTFLYIYAYAKSEETKGYDVRIILKIDDTKRTENPKEKASLVFDFLNRDLGLAFDLSPFNGKTHTAQPLYQSERGGIYKKYLARLIDNGYAHKNEADQTYSFDLKRYILKHESFIRIKDLVLGDISFDLTKCLKSNQESFLITRSDGSFLYNFASTVDDGELEVTDVIRGQDKISSLPFQEAIRVALGFNAKNYAHVPIMLDDQGKRLKGDTFFSDFLNMGISKNALISYILTSGYGDSNKNYNSLDNFIKTFDIVKIHKNNSKIDLARLKNINLLHDR